MPIIMLQPSTGEHALGDRDGRVALVEYGDYQCPRCAAVQRVVAAILLQYPTGLRFVFRHFPIARAHPMAALAAETAEYAALYDRFWPMHEALLSNAHRISLAMLFALGRQFFIPADRLRDALAIGLCADKVQRDMAQGRVDQVDDTPAFFVNGRRFTEAVDESALKNAIEAAMKAAPRPVLHLKVANARSNKH